MESVEFIQELATMELTFDDFRLLSKADYSYRFAQWHIVAPDLGWFHYFSPWRRSSGLDGSHYRKQAWSLFDTILQHNGDINLVGIFLKYEKVVVYDSKKRDTIFIKLAYSPILKRWFNSECWQLGDSGHYSAPSLNEQSHITRRAAIEDSLERLRARLSSSLTPTVLKTLSAPSAQPEQGELF